MIEIAAKAGAGTHQWDLKIGTLINREFIVVSSLKASLTQLN